MAKRKRKNNKKRWKSTRMYDTYDVNNYQKSLDFDYGEDKGTYFYSGDTRKEVKLAFKVGELSFWGGPESQICRRDNPWDVVITLGEMYDFLINEIYVSKLNKVVKFISIPWRNNDAPSLSLNDWQSVVAEFPTQGNVAVCCFGGRGRTGTALAILRAVMVNDTSDPVLSIRSSYNKYAIESDVQVRYIERITGLQSNCEGSDERYFYGYNADFYHFDGCFGGYEPYGCYESNLDGSADKTDNDVISAVDEQMERSLRRKLRGLARARTY
jgi:hypothetical protein